MSPLVLGHNCKGSTSLFKNSFQQSQRHDAHGAFARTFALMLICCMCLTVFDLV
jgi:hypothetical protein